MKAGGGRQVQVGLDELAAGDVPLAALDQAADAGEEVGAQLLGLLVEPGLAAGEDELGVFVAAVGRRGIVASASSAPACQGHSHTGSIWALPIMWTRIGTSRIEGAAASSFTAPAISAPMMKRCSTRKTTTAGTMESTLAAARIWVEVWL